MNAVVVTYESGFLFCHNKKCVYAEKEEKKVLWMTIFRLWTRPIDSCRERTQQTAVKILEKRKDQPIVGKIYTYTQYKDEKEEEGKGK